MYINRSTATFMMETVLILSCLLFTFEKWPYLAPSLPELRTVFRVAIFFSKNLYIGYNKNNFSALGGAVQAAEKRWNCQLGDHAALLLLWHVCESLWTGQKSEFLFVDLTDSTLGRSGGTVTKEQFWYLVNWITIFIQLWLPLCTWWWWNSFNRVILLN